MRIKPLVHGPWNLSNQMLIAFLTQANGLVFLGGEESRSSSQITSNGVGVGSNQLASRGTLAVVASRMFKGGAGPRLGWINDSTGTSHRNGQVETQLSVLWLSGNTCSSYNISAVTSCIYLQRINIRSGSFSDISNSRVAIY